MINSQATMRHILRTTAAHRRVRLAAVATSLQNAPTSSSSGSTSCSSLGAGLGSAASAAGSISTASSVASTAGKLSRKAVLARCSELALVSSKQYIENPLVGYGDEGGDGQGDVDVTVWTLTL